MRPIKFRCFIKSKNTMFPVVSIVNMNDEEGIRVFPYKPVIEGEQLNYLTSDGDIELMQFTGLTDKNGKEIYEGDIIFEKGQNREVIFHKGCFCVRHFEVDDYPLNRNTYHIFSHEHVEIIGNIYQNPEFLTN